MEDQFSFIQNNGILLAMVGMLLAVPKTPLFKRLEQEGRLTVDFGQIKETYLRQLRLYLDQLRTGCQKTRADYIFTDTGMDVYDAVLQRRKIG
jgi:hypothetical protein